MKFIQKAAVCSAIVLGKVFMAASSLGGVALPAQYSAELIHSADGKSMIQKLYVNGEKMRSEIAAGGKAHIVLLDKKAGLVTVLDQDSKTFSVYPYRPNVSNPSVLDFELVNDPQAKVEDLGSELVEGVGCAKRKVTTSRGTIIYWTHSKTGLPVRMQSVDGHIQIDWRNVVVGPVATSVFEIPEGFTKKG